MKTHIMTPSKLFGVSCTPQKASLVIIPVPWDVTVSSRSGTALGPEIILKASYQLEMFQHEYPDAAKMGVSMLPIPQDWKMLSDTLRHHTVGYIHALESGFEKSTLKKSIVKKIDDYAYQLKEDIKTKAQAYLDKGKMVAVLGGDHSTPLGLIEALSDVHNNFGVLQIDAQPGMRRAHRGFTYSYASIMHNVLELPYITKLVQVGLRSYSVEEAKDMKAEEGRVVPFFMQDMRRKAFQGASWDELCTPIIEALPEKVYISFDIDGLDAGLCPSTGTPMPGGLSFDEVVYLFERVVKAGKKIIGFDLCEVAPGDNMDWDAQVGSHVLYKLAIMMGASQGKIKLDN